MLTPNLQNDDNVNECDIELAWPYPTMKVLIAIDISFPVSYTIYACMLQKESYHFPSR